MFDAGGLRAVQSPVSDDWQGVDVSRDAPSLSRTPVIDGCQYCNWSEAIFRQMREGGVDAVIATICYHEDFRETVERIIDWNGRFAAFAGMIQPCRGVDDIASAMASGRTAIFYALQNCSAIEDDIGLVEILHTLGVRVMQLTYNNQSLLGTGCYEANDSGITRMGREVIREMNRLGMIIDMSHSSERSTLEAIELSARPIAITHANPHAWHAVPRNKSDTVLKALAGRGGVIGLSLYPHHLREGSNCTLDSFVAMVMNLVGMIGVEHVAIGSDLCQNQPDEVVAWMRAGRWTKGAANIGLGKAVFPQQPPWFTSNLGFSNVREGLRAGGLSAGEVDMVLGGNWLRFLDAGLRPSSA